MQYISTRGQCGHFSFSEALLTGLAPDGGLLLPKHYPHIDTRMLARWRILSYADLAFEILSLFATDIPSEDLRRIVRKTYNAEVFGSEEVTPVRALRDGIRIQALSNGPTLAFKDMAMQLLGNLFEYVLAREGKTLNIIGATSGDTGSAAEYALRGKAGINVFMLSPHGKMSAFQRAQMYSLTDKNIHNIAIEGMFDDCQDIIKTLQNDDRFKEEYHLSTVNSINWGRIAAQIVYYFKGYFEATQSEHEEVSFCVPSGNFGNICAGHIAKQMGLPIRRLILATNENDVLHDFFTTGRYKPRGTANTWVTSSPSMDISKASNFERFVFDVMERDDDPVRALWAQVDAGKGFDLGVHLDVIRNRYGFVSGKSLHADRIRTIAEVYADGDGLIDPHTADGVKVARELREADEKIICLETALPAKFAETIVEAVGGGVAIPRPAALVHLEQLPQHVTVLPNNAAAVKMVIKERLDGAA